MTRKCTHAFRKFVLAIVLYSLVFYGLIFYISIGINCEVYCWLRCVFMLGEI